MRIVESKIPKNKRILRDVHGNKFKIKEYDYYGMENLEQSYIIVKDATCFQEFKCYFTQIENNFKEITGEKFAKCIEKYDYRYNESEIKYIENIDENGIELTKEDWIKMTNNLDAPREKYESRPVVSEDGKLFYNASSACRNINVNPTNCDKLYRAVENKNMYKKLYWRYANKKEVLDYIGEHYGKNDI